MVLKEELCETDFVMHATWKIGSVSVAHAFRFKIHTLYSVTLNQLKRKKKKEEEEEEEEEEYIVFLLFYME